jgi:hypothetical protein
LDTIRKIQDGPSKGTLISIFFKHQFLIGGHLHPNVFPIFSLVLSPNYQWNLPSINGMFTSSYMRDSLANPCFVLGFLYRPGRCLPWLVYGWQTQ